MLKKISALILAIVMLMSSPLLSNNASAVSGFEIADAAVSSVSENVLATISEIDGLTVYNKIIFHRADDYADLTLTILNNSRNIRKITDITDN